MFIHGIMNFLFCQLRHTSHLSSDYSGKELTDISVYRIFIDSDPQRSMLNWNSIGSQLLASEFECLQKCEHAL